MPTRRRRRQPRSRKTLLDYPQLFRRRPSTAATRVNNFKATDVASVSKVIHTDNQLHPGQFGKAAYTGWIPPGGDPGLSCGLSRGFQVNQNDLWELQECLQTPRAQKKTISALEGASQPVGSSFGPFRNV